MPGIFLLKLKEVGLNCVQQQSAITIIAFTSGEKMILRDRHVTQKF